MSLYPAKTAKRIFRPTGRDFLGQQPIIQHMANQCLPSFTNSTRRVRYYSFWAWAFEMLKRNEKAFHNSKEIRLYLMKLEAALIICNKYLDVELTGLAGVSQIPFDLNFDKLKNNSKIKLVDGLRSATSYSAVRYKPSLSTLNIVALIDGKIKMMKYSEPLANIYDENISKAKGYKQLIDPSTDFIEWSLLKSLCESFDMCNIKDKEINTFIEIIEQNENKSGLLKSNSPRVKIVLLLLDLIEKNTIRERSDIGKRIYFNQYKPNKALLNTFLAYKVIEFRRYYQFAIENLLAMFCSYLFQADKQEGTFKDFVDLLFRSLKNIKGIDSLNYKIDVEPIKSEKLGSYINRIYSSNWFKRLNEDVILSIITSQNKKYRNTLSTDSANWSIILLFKLFNKVDELESSDSENKLSLLSYPRGFKHSISAYKSHLTKSMQLPVKEGLFKIVTDLSLKLHLAVSQDKVFSPGSFTFRYVRAEPVGFKYLNKLAANRTANKIEVFTEILLDLELISHRNNLYTVTKKGREYFQKNIA